MTRLTLRIDFDEGRALGPGKVRLLELIGDTGSISAAGRAMGMSYRRAWLLVDALNKTFRTAVVETREGGAGGGGASLTDFGSKLVTSYRMIEQDATRAVPYQGVGGGALDGSQRLLPRRGRDVGCGRGHPMTLTHVPSVHRVTRQ